MSIFLDNLNPIDLATIGRQDEIRFQLTLEGVTLKLLTIWARMVGETRTRVVYDSTGFKWPYHTRSTLVPNAAGTVLSVSVQRVGGWPDNIAELLVCTVDSNGVKGPTAQTPSLVFCDCVNVVAVAVEPWDVVGPIDEIHFGVGGTGLGTVLSGDANEAYVIQLRFHANAGGGFGGIFIRPNGVGPGRYCSVQANAASLIQTATSSASMTMGFKPGVIDAENITETLFHAHRFGSINRGFLGGSGSRSPGGAPRMDHVGSHWLDSAADLTTIEIDPSGINPFGNGTTCTLWKQKVII